MQVPSVLAKLAALVPGVLYQYRLYPDGRSCFPYSSPGIEDIYEVSPEDVREDASLVFTRLHPEDLESTAAAIHDSARALAPFHWEFRVVLPRQGLRWRSCNATPERLPDGGTLWHGIITDITARKKAEAALLNMQKLESLGVFAGGVAHDFNNVLSVILGNISLLKLQTKAEGEALELINEVQDACATAKGLAKQLLTFAKGGSPIVKVVDLRSVLKQAAVFAARGSNARCVFDLGKKPLAANIDEDQVAQVFRNLVLNAAQAMPRGGDIAIRARVVTRKGGELPRLKAGRYVEVTLADQGTGIEAERLPRIFDPYFSTKAGGRGLGLSVCHSIMAKHGGFIGAESKPGAGALFSLYFPSPSADIQRDQTPALITPGRGRVLIMDDEASVARILKRLLERLGCEAQCAAHGQAALDAYADAMKEGKPYDAVIMDLTVPGGMGGKEMLVKLLALHPKAKAIVSSGYCDDPVMAAWEKHGFCGALAKPCRFEDVAEVLRRAIGSKTSPDADP